MTKPEYRTQVKRWFVEIGVCDGGGIGHWIETTESVEVTGEAEANALRDDWLASGKLMKMPWGGLRPQNPYGLFRVRQVWEDTPAPTDAAQARDAALRADEMLRVAARYIRDHYPDGLIRYDDADCDGACVADDCEAAADALIGKERT